MSQNNTNPGNKPDVWLPPQAAIAAPAPNGRPASQNIFEKVTRNVRRVGFDVKARHDRVERVVEVMFIPQNDKTKQAVKVASGSSQATGLKTMVNYGALDDPFYATIACIEKGLEELRQAL